MRAAGALAGGRRPAGDGAWLSALPARGELGPGPGLSLASLGFQSPAADDHPAVTSCHTAAQPQTRRRRPVQRRLRWIVSIVEESRQEQNPLGLLASDWCRQTPFGSIQLAFFHCFLMYRLHLRVRHHVPDVTATAFPRATLRTTCHRLYSVYRTCKQ